MNSWTNKEYKIQLYTTSLLLMIASADDDINLKEISVIKNVINDFFKISSDLSDNLIQNSYKVLEGLTDTYEIASFINDSLNNDQKMSLLTSMYKIAYSDNEFHYIERHFIYKIGNIFNFNKNKIIEAKKI